jgi:glycerophosphoryl diester phosphodiesterase
MKYFEAVSSQKMNAKLAQAFQAKPFLIEQHRCGKRGDVVENTALAAHASFLLGADICEFDVAQSKDGVFYCFHSGSEERLFGHSFPFEESTSTEIDALPLLNSLGLPSEFHAERLDFFLSQFQHGELLNLDRGFFHFATLLPFLNARKENWPGLILKTPCKKEWLDPLESNPIKYMVIPILNERSDPHEQLKLIESYSHINIVGYELSFQSLSSPIIQERWIDAFHQQGFFCLGNAMKLSAEERNVISAGCTDNVSIEKGFDQGWGKLLDLGFDVIQTDWPELLVRYREQRK